MMSDWRSGAKFSDAAKATDNSEKTIRGWLDRKQINLGAENGRESGWRRFTPRDIAILALVRILSFQGMPIADAGAFALAELDGLGISDVTAPYDLLQILQDRWIGFQQSTPSQNGYLYLRASCREEAVAWLDFGYGSFLRLRNPVRLAFVRLGWDWQENEVESAA